MNGTITFTDSALRAVRLALAVIGGSCLVSLMYAFMGGSATNADFAALNVIQRFGIVLSILVVLFCVGSVSRGRSARETYQTLWQHIPGWLVFVILLLGSLVFIGELSYALLLRAELVRSEWENHVALLCLLSSSVAYGVVFALLHQRAGLSPYSKERW